jgi:acetolactate synthase I/II/III large subunit
MDLELGHDVATGFSNPDLMAYAESFEAWGYRVNSTADLLPILSEALAADTVSVIACPVDYSENLRLTDAQGEYPGPYRLRQS